MFKNDKKFWHSNKNKDKYQKNPLIMGQHQIEKANEFICGTSSTNCNSINGGYNDPNCEPIVHNIHNGKIICDSNTTCTDISTSNRDYYNIPKNSKYSSSRNNNNNNNNNSKCGSKIPSNATITAITKLTSPSSTLNLCSIDNDSNNINNNSSNNKCNFEIQCENGIRNHNGINNCNILHNSSNHHKKGSLSLKDQINLNDCIDCHTQNLQQLKQQQQSNHHHYNQSSSLSSVPSNSSMINKKNKKNLLVSRSVDDLRHDDNLFNYPIVASELLKYNNKQHLQQQLQHQQQQQHYNCCINDNNYNKNHHPYINSNIRNNNININNHSHLKQSSTTIPEAFITQKILTNNSNNNINNNNNNNNNNINISNKNIISNKILQHNFPKQKSALYQIKNKHYSMDNLLTAVNQHFIDYTNNNNNNNICSNFNNINCKKGYHHYQGDADRPQFVAVTSLDDCQAIRCAEFHPNGKLYAVGSNSKTFRICEYPSLVEIREDHTAYQPTIVYEKQKYHKGSIYCMDWSPDGELIATGSNDKTIKLMRYNDDNKELEGREIELTMHDGTIRDICFIEDTSNKASLLISGGAGDNKIYVTDCGTATPFQALSGHSGHILSLYNWGGAMFVSGSHDKTIRFWDLRTRSCVNTITPSTQPGIRHGSPVAAVSVDPSGRLLVSGHEDSSCVLYDIRGNRPIQCFKPHTADIRSIRFSPSAYYLLTAGYDKKLMLTDLQGDLTLQLPSVVVAHHSDKVISGRWHPTDFSFLSTSADKTCILWALTSKP